MAQVLGHIRQQVIADRIRVPVGPGEEVLHPVGGPVAQALGQLPAVLPLGITQQATDVADRPPPRLAPGETPADPPGHRRQLARPPHHLFTRRSSCHRPPSP